jgi:O-antigen ligase
MSDLQRGTGAFDIAGLGLCAAAAGWTIVSALITGGDPLPVAALFIAVGASYGAARVIATRSRWLVPAVVAGAIVISAWLFRSDLPSTLPLDGPLHYTNASAALYLQATIAGLMLSFVGPSRSLRAAGLVAALLLGGATVLTNSQAADVLLALPLIAQFCRSSGSVRVCVLVFGALVLAALIASVALGLANPTPGGEARLSRLVADTVTERRPELWHDALMLMERHPLAGVGPARFQYKSSIALSDPDARWAHNGFLQEGAEGGFPALLIVIGLFVWSFLRLGRGEDPDTVTALGAAALGALGVQATIDYLFHFPALPLVAAALVGVAVTGGRVPIDAVIEGDDLHRVA